ncbi:MAG: DUF4465 domain-containing protein [Bacteroidota bacterium]
MKKAKQITLAISIIFSIVVKAQVVNETFDTFTLSPNSYYQDSSGANWRSSATIPVSFEYGWKNGLWTSGSVYTNIKDTLNLTTSNMLAAATGIAKNGANYVTVKDSAKIYLENSPTFLNKISGFFITNTAYVKNIVKNGDATHRKFGDTTGTGWGGSTAQGGYPDWLKVTVFGYHNGSQNPNYIDFYLADYQSTGTANDYIVDDWYYINCINVGFVDSIQLIMSSSDKTSNYKMKTPGYFCIDHFTTTNNVGINELDNVVNIKISPNPTNQNLVLDYALISSSVLNISVFDISGKEVIKNHTQQDKIGHNQLLLNTEALEAGIYFLNVSNGTSNKKIKFIKL